MPNLYDKSNPPPHRSSQRERPVGPVSSAPPKLVQSDLAFTGTIDCQRSSVPLPPPPAPLAAPALPMAEPGVSEALVGEVYAAVVAAGPAGATAAELVDGVGFRLVVIEACLQCCAIAGTAVGTGRQRDGAAVWAAVPA